MGFLSKIKEAVSGRKTYIVAVVGLVTALVAWSSGELTDVQFIEAIFAAIATMTVRAGVTKSGPG